MFRRYQVDVKDIKCLWNDEEYMNPLFSTIFFSFVRFLTILN